MFSSSAELVTPGGKPDANNFWACANGHSEPSMTGDVAIVGVDGAKQKLIRDRRCAECGEHMSMIHHKGRGFTISFRNTWDN